MGEYLLMGLDIKNLPKSLEGHLLPYSIDMLEEVIEESDPQNILEIGFNTGQSAYYWLTLSNATLTSIDINHWPETQVGADKVKKEWPDRFQFIGCDSKKLPEEFELQVFDLVFIDGDHSVPGIINDLELALRMEIPYIFIDDYTLQVKDVVDTYLGYKFEVVKEYEVLEGVWEDKECVVRQPAILTKRIENE